MSGAIRPIESAPRFAALEIGLADQLAVLEPDSAFWALIPRDLRDQALDGNLLQGKFRKHAEECSQEMAQLRFGLKPSAVYFNPTDRCNLNCGYCYLPDTMRRGGKTMTAQELCDALELLLAYFRKALPTGAKPQVIFHGSEPMIAREAVFAGIVKFHQDFHFGVQTNGTLLDEPAMAFLKEHRVAIGISLDGPDALRANLVRRNWRGDGVFDRVVRVLKSISDYPAFNVITTVTKLNVEDLVPMVDFYHGHGVGTVMLNPVRCTQPGGAALKPDDALFWNFFSRALDRSYELYAKTGQKLVIANFANVLAGVLGPTTRRLMCDISPCGGGRCFFAVSAHGDVFPCSEFIGFPESTGGNLRRNSLAEILDSKSFREITDRKIEAIGPCSSCPIRHFCGAPCPAEIKAVSGTLNAASPYCEFYQEQVRYAFRIIAQGRERAYLWDGWDEETQETFSWKNC